MQGFKSACIKTNDVEDFSKKFSAYLNYAQYANNGFKQLSFYKKSPRSC